jgi:hypothetical protein
MPLAACGTLLGDWVQMARDLREFAYAGLLNMAPLPPPPSCHTVARACLCHVGASPTFQVGGCCGSTPDHIRAIALAVTDATPRIVKPREPVMR